MTLLNSTARATACRASCMALCREHSALLAKAIQLVALMDSSTKYYSHHSNIAIIHINNNHTISIYCYHQTSINIFSVNVHVDAGDWAYSGCLLWTTSLACAKLWPLDCSPMRLSTSAPLWRAGIRSTQGWTCIILCGLPAMVTFFTDSSPSMVQMYDKERVMSLSSG